jgi:hypothetical protein
MAVHGDFFPIHRSTVKMELIRSGGGAGAATPGEDEAKMK